MSQTRMYPTLTVIMGLETVVLQNAIEDADDMGHRVLVGRVTGGTFGLYGREVHIQIGSAERIRRLCEDTYAVINREYDATVYHYPQS